MKKYLCIVGAWVALAAITASGQTSSSGGNQGTSASSQGTTSSSQRAITNQFGGASRFGTNSPVQGQTRLGQPEQTRGGTPEQTRLGVPESDRAVNASLGSSKTNLPPSGRNLPPGLENKDYRPPNLE